MTDAVSQLASQLATATTSGPPQPTIVQGVIVSWQNTASPPTVTITMSGDTAQIPNIQYLDSYAPNPGDVVQIVKQNGSLLVMGKLSTAAPVTSVGGLVLSGTAASGDLIQSTSSTAARWTPLAQGSGTTSQCLDPAGPDRTTQPMFWYVNSIVVNVSTGSGWDWTSGGITFTGCGVVLANPGDIANGLTVVSVDQTHCFIDGSNNLNVGGACYTVQSDNTITGCTPGGLVRINIAALCW